LRAIEGKEQRNLVATCIEVYAKFGKVSIESILPSRNTAKKKLDNKDSAVKKQLIC